MSHHDGDETRPHKCCVSCTAISKGYADGCCCHYRHLEHGGEFTDMVQETLQDRPSATHRITSVGGTVCGLAGNSVAVRSSTWKETTCRHCWERNQWADKAIKEALA